MTDYYSLLNVSPKASVTEIKSAFKKIAKTNHPDINPSFDEKKFMEMTEGYKILIDENKRKEYDRSLLGTIYNSGLSNIFDQFFNNLNTNKPMSTNEKERSSMNNLVVLQGDLLKSDCTIICHCCNCFSTMGAGIALQIVKKFPETLEADKNFVKTIVGEEKFKSMSRNKQADLKFGRCSRTFSKDKTKVIVNLYGQYYYGTNQVQTDYDKLHSAIEEMLQGIKKLEDKGFPIKIGVPYKMASHLAGGDWNRVSKILNELGEKYNRIIYAYKKN